MQQFYHTTTNLDWIVLTADARQAVRAGGAANGLLVIAVPAPGAGVLCCDTHPDVRDALLDWVAKQGEPYTRDILNRRRETIALAARVQAPLLGRSLVLPIVDHELACSSDTDIVLIDCDARAGRREVQMHIVAGGGGAPAGSGGPPPQGDPYGP